MTLDGFNQVGGAVTGNIKDVKIISKQNTSTTDGSSQSVGGSITFGGMPSFSVGASETTGNRSYVDTPSSLIIGEGSNLTIGNLDNTAGIVGTKDGGKMTVGNYTGHDLINVDEYNTTGGNLSFGGVEGINEQGQQTTNFGLTGLGVTYQNKEKEGVSNNTVVGDVTIGTATGDAINYDESKAQETTKDEDTGLINFNLDAPVLGLLTEDGRRKFKVDLYAIKKEIQKRIEKFILPNIKKILEKQKLGKNLSKKELKDLEIYNLVLAFDGTGVRTQMDKDYKENCEYMKENGFSFDGKNTVKYDLYSIDEKGNMSFNESEVKRFIEDADNFRSNNNLSETEYERVETAVASVLNTLYSELILTNKSYQDFKTDWINRTVYNISIAEKLGELDGNIYEREPKDGEVMAWETKFLKIAINSINDSLYLYLYSNQAILPEVMLKLDSNDDGYVPNMEDGYLISPVLTDSASNGYNRGNHTISLKLGPEYHELTHIIQYFLLRNYDTLSKNGIVSDLFAVAELFKINASFNIVSGLNYGNDLFERDAMGTYNGTTGRSIDISRNIVNPIPVKR